MRRTLPTTSLGNARSVTVFAPASVGNVAVGFDVVGHAISGIGDTVRVDRSDEPGVRVAAVSNCEEPLPSDTRNTAAAAVAAMAEALQLEGGFELTIDKGIPLGSGMGGSAASAAAAVSAVNQMLKIPLPAIELYPFAMAGERAASGEAHGDNVGPSLLGGLTVSVAGDPARVIQVPVPNQLRCVVARPHLVIKTRDARSVLPAAFERHLVVNQMANLAGFLVGCLKRDLDLIAACLADVIVEPVRASRVPGFPSVKAAALDAGAMGCSLSGSGPAVFAWFRSEAAARSGCEAMLAAFEAAGLAADGFVSPVNSPGARQL